MEYNNINLQGGLTSKNVTSIIVSDYDRQLARERSQKLKEEGLTVKDRLSKIRKHLTSTKLTIDGRHYHMDKYVYQHAKNRQDEDEVKKQVKRRKFELEYAILCYKADRARECNPSDNVKDWRKAADIKDYLGPLKVKNVDPAWPTQRPQFEILYSQWSNRRRIQLVMERCVMNKFNEWVRSKNSKHATLK